MAKTKKTACVGDNCVACGNCVKYCLFGAISIYKGLYAVTNEKCVGCGKCAKACPADVIKIIENEKESELHEKSKALV